MTSDSLRSKKTFKILLKIDLSNEKSFRLLFFFYWNKMKLFESYFFALRVKKCTENGHGITIFKSFSVFLFQNLISTSWNVQNGMKFSKILNFKLIGHK